MIKRLLAISAFLFCFSCVNAEPTALIDTPTTNVLSYASYNLQFRFFGAGGLTTSAEFGVFNNINLGLSWELQRFLGNGSVEVAMPALLVKARVFSGNAEWPSLAVGFDGQGYFWNSDADEYAQDGKGLYVVLGKEIFIPTLNYSLGCNINSLDDMILYVFTGASIDIVTDKLRYMLEWDNINKMEDSRLNTGLRYFVTKAISLDFYFRDLCAPEGHDRVPRERVFKLSYQSKF